MSEKVITVGLDIGHINYKGLSADLIIPGAKSRLLDPLGKETIGAFIIANKHDLPDALELDTIKKRMARADYTCFSNKRRRTQSNTRYTLRTYMQSLGSAKLNQQLHGWMHEWARNPYYYTVRYV